MAPKSLPQYIKVEGHVYKLALQAQQPGQPKLDERVQALRVKLIPQKLQMLGTEIAKLPVPPFTADSDSYMEAMVSVKDAINEKVKAFLMEIGHMLKVEKPLEANTKRKR